MLRSYAGFLSILFLIFLIPTAHADSPNTWVSLNSNTPALKPTAIILKSDAEETLVKFQIAGFWSRDVQVADQTYQRLKLPGYAGTLEVGRPQLPAISELVAVPGHAAVTVEILDVREEILNGYRVFPFQEPRLEADPDPGFSEDTRFYAQDAFFPENLASVGSPCIWRDLRVVNLRVHPLQHNPGTGELKVYSEIVVRLSYEGLSQVNVKEPLLHPVAENFDRMYGQRVINYRDLNLPVGAAEKLDGAYDYLIIAADTYVDDLGGFAAYKATLGLATNIVPVSQVGSSAFAIKDFIELEYFNNGIRYVLLVGNPDDVPVYMGYGCASDYFYGILEGDDDYADLAVGRFSVDDAQQLQNMISKTTVFESFPPAGDWLEKSLLVANYELAPDKYQLCKEEVRTATDTASQTYSVLYPEFTTAYGASTAVGGDEATNADVTGYFNEGFRLVNYRGHGELDNWWSWNIYQEDFEITDVLALDNGQLTPVVFSITCLNNAINKKDEAIGEVFTRSEAAAVAYLGASAPSYTDPNHDLDKMLYAAVFDEGINAIGDASNEAFVQVINLWGSYGLDTVRMYLWLGDPSLQLIFNGAAGPAAPELVSPTDGSPFDPPVQVLLDWAEVATAVSYQVMLDDDLDFSSPVAQQEELTLTEWTTPELGGGLYFWRVRATDGQNYGGWSEVWGFQVGIVAQAPVMIAPLEGTVIRLPQELILKWYEVIGAASYYLEVDDHPSFSSPERTATVDTTGGAICSFEVLPELEVGQYYWRVKVGGPLWPWSETWGFKISPPGGKKDPFDPTRLVSLEGNYPNPFNPMTNIFFRLPEAMPVRLRIYDVSGKLVRTLLDGQSLPAGRNEVVWDGRDSRGRGAATGTYFCRLEAQNMVLNKRMTLLK